MKNAIVPSGRCSLEPSRKRRLLARLVVYTAFSLIIGQLVIRLPAPYQNVFGIALCVACVGVLVWVIYEVYFRRESSPELDRYLEDYKRRKREREKP